jgi:enolase-phosphatase E1
MIKAIITDIEGTTSSLSFVKEMLFPYARAHLAEFVRSHAAALDVKTALDEVRKIVAQPLDTEQCIKQLLEWIDQDQKVTPLKALQGLIWDAGYQQGDFEGHIYLDAVENLKVWYAQGLSLYVYSSGSVHAQKLLFAHTEFGDLTPIFSGYFDTNIGGKQQTESYQRIVEQIGLSAEQLLFLSDITAELNAAQQAGMATIQLVRDSELDKQATHKQVASFNDINLNR